MQFGDRLKLVMEQSGIDRWELKRLTGVSASYIHEIENNAYLPSREVQERFAAALGVSPEDLEP